jgi:hypothetical protein
MIQNGKWSKLKSWFKKYRKQKPLEKKGTILGLKHGSKKWLKSQRRQFGYIKIKIRPFAIN